MSQASAAVQRGAKLLDNLVPNWINKVKPEHLVMADGSQCMLGQTFTDFSIGVEALAQKALDKAVAGKVVLAVVPEIDSVHYGFESDNSYGYQELENAWMNLLHRRQIKPKAAKKRKR